MTIQQVYQDRFKKEGIKIEEKGFEITCLNCGSHHATAEADYDHNVFIYCSDCENYVEVIEFVDKNKGN